MPARKTTSAQDDSLWDGLSVLSLVLMLGLLVVFGLIYLNPHTQLNPLPPPTLPPTIVLPSATPILATQPPSPTPPPSATPSPTATITPTPTPLPTIVQGTAFQVSAEPTATATRPSSAYPYTLQGEPAAIRGDLYHPQEGCNWQGVAGQVFNPRGAPVLYVGVQFGGRIGNRYYSETVLTGYAPDYVPYGYEFKLGEQPAASNGTLWVRLVDQQGLPLSDKVFLTTYSDCDHNLLLVNFKQTR